MYKYLYSICILTLNQVEITKKCLLSLVQTNFDGDAEIILVDNGSTDGTVDWLIQFQKKYCNRHISISIVVNHENKGCTGGRNQAMSMANGKYIVILDNDVEIIERHWLESLRKYYVEHEGIGIIGPKLVYAEDPDIIQTAGLGVTKEGSIGYWGQGKRTSDPEYSHVREVQGYPAACWLFEKGLLNDVGLFDEVYYPVQYEDIDFCFKVREQGYKIIYYPYVKLLHYEHITTRQTEGLHYNRVTVKNGITFKLRWKHVYEVEEGMKIEDITWVK